MQYLPPFLATLVIGIFTCDLVIAQSSLLESVKNNPEEAGAMCQKFKKYNSEGIQTNSEKVISEISQQKNLSQKEAEILSLYVIGMYCPNVR